ncbi:related to exopolysaccharide biosynthesis protein (GumC protein) [Desulfotalea psychrophila LSv54]|uniref:Related to exopolysaccharide biosynthesis protein (GumC protein) n=2 Tax=Desulfotalea psychrophila TaxID=84980 RepID=Q6AI98_DESPS|nr:related to exopolysaccharide biosynthesis protein (GumC protein) [Desulfotalea psychrophila LSv54]
MAASFMMKPVYQATANLVIDKEQTSSPLTGERIDNSSYASQLLTFNTHFKLIHSKPVVLALVKKLKLDEKEEDVIASPLARIKQQIKANIKLLLARFSPEQDGEASELSEDEKLASLVKQIQDLITIEQVRDTRLLTISAENTDPVLASRLANTLAREYIEFDMESRLSSSKENLEWMNGQLYQLKKRLEDGEQKFHDFKQVSKLFSIDGKQQEIGHKIEEFNDQYLEARNKRQEIDAKLAEIKRLAASSGDITHIRSLLGNPSIDAISENLTRLELQRTRLTKVYKSKHPKMVQIDSEISKNRFKIRIELKKELENLKTERAILLSKEQIMEENVAQFEDEAVDASGKELRYTILQRNLTTSQSLYDTLVSKIKESNLLSSGTSSNIRVVEYSSVPVAPVSPNKRKNLLLALVLGLFGGIGLAFLLEYFDQSIRTEDDLRTYLDIPVLATVPSTDMLNASKEGY